MIGEKPTGSNLNGRQRAIGNERDGEFLTAHSDYSASPLPQSHYCTVATRPHHPPCALISTHHRLPGVLRSPHQGKLTGCNDPDALLSRNPEALMMPEGQKT